MKNQSVKDAVIQNIRRSMADFGINEFELLERITVKLDAEQFKWKEDESVWLQKKDKAPKVCEVYFDNVWCCDLYETDTHHRVLEKFFKGFEKGYALGKIRLNKFLATIEAEKEKQAEIDKKAAQKKAIESIPTTTPEEKVAKEIVKEIVQEGQNADPHPTAST
jgi:hypothetical protein